MDNKIIQSILEDALEEEIPSTQVNLWPAVKADLVAGKHQLNQQGKKMNTIKPRPKPRFALATTLVLAFLVIFFVTPQGRSFAKSVMELFTRAESKMFPLKDSQTATTEPDLAQPPAPLLSVAEAEAQVGFNLAVIPFVPEGFEYLGARVIGNNVSIEYQAQGGGGNLIIMQSREGFYQSDWDNVPADAIIPVKVGELDGEFTQGTFVVYPEQTSATWNPDAPLLRLRWVNNGVWFEITKFGNVNSIEYLDQKGLIDLAESLNNQP